MTKERVFAEGQLVLKVADYVMRGMTGPAKFAPKWEGPFVIREAHQSGYVRDRAPGPLFYRMLGQTHVNGWSRVIASQNGSSTSCIFPP